MGSGMCGAGLSVCSLSKDRVRRTNLLLPLFPDSLDVVTAGVVVPTSVVWVSVVAGEMVGFVPSYCRYRFISER